MIGDALSHTSLAGVAAGLIFNISPVLGAVIACTLAAISIEAIRKKLPKYSEISIVLIMSLGIGLAGVLSDKVKSTASFDSFLFGSILSITNLEVYIISGLSALVLIAFLILYRELFYITFDEKSARLSGVKVNVVNFIFTVLTAVTVSIASRTVGALIVSSMMVIPVACSMQVSKSYFTTVIFSVLFALGFTILGLFVSYYQGLKPGSVIVLIGVISFLIIALIKKVFTLLRKIKVTKEV
jgi:zinc transport system permease protein